MRTTTSLTTSEEYDIRILNDPDYLNAPNYDNSLAKVRLAHPEGVPDKDIAKYLGMPIEQIELIRDRALEKLRKYLR